LGFWVTVYITAVTGTLGNNTRFFDPAYASYKKYRHEIAYNFALVFLPLNVLLVYKFWKGVKWWMTIRYQKTITGDTVVLLNAQKERHLGTFNQYYLTSWAFYFSSFISLGLLWMIGGDSLSYLSYVIISIDLVFCLVTWMLLHCYIKRIDYETLNVIKHVAEFNVFVKN